MTVEEVPRNANTRNINKLIYYVLVLSTSFLSVLCDVLLGLAVIMQYYSLGNTSWAIITFTSIFFPSVVLQIRSIKLYLSNRKMLPLQWFFHSLLLGILYRYINAFRKCLASYKAKSFTDSNLVKADIIILKNLYLFKSFFECAPQLVLQLYFASIAPFSIPLTGILASTSAFSIAWALLIHTKFKKGNFFGLIFLILWRLGMLTARISALVLCAYSCGPWIVLFIGSHWLAVTLWITYQKAATDDKDKKGEFHSALFGVIYCFCFFSIKIGHSRSKALILNSLLLFQNLIFLTVFLMSFSAESPRLSILSFMTVVFGSLLGVTSFFIYNAFFHSRGNFKCVTSMIESLCCKSTNGLFKKQSNYPKLRKGVGKRTPDSIAPKLVNEQLQGVQSPSDSIVIIEETPTENSQVDGEMLASPSVLCENICVDAKQNVVEKEIEEMKLSAALKRRAICSSVDLTRFLDGKTEEAASECNRDSKAVANEETPSEILSTHDYENLCAVNIAREPWGIRSWRVYSDIETCRHDDSVFNERRLDNMTTSSEYSGKIEDKDSLNIAEDDLLNCDIDTNSDKTSVNFVPPFPASMLHTIIEESPSDFEDIQIKGNSESTLVATIDKICLYTPLRIRSVSYDYYVENPEIRPLPGNEIKNVTFDGENTLMQELHLENEKKDGISPIKEKIRYIPKFNIFRERYETNRYRVGGKVNDLKAEVSEQNEPKKENVSDDSYKIENNVTKKSFSLRDGSSFFVQMLSPSKLEKRTFPISPIKHNSVTINN